MTKKLALICITIAILLIFAVSLWTLRYRYDKKSIRGVSIPIRTNRITGKTQMYNPFTMEWISSDSSGPPVILPTSERGKVNFETLQVGSSWNITKVGIEIQVKRRGGIVRLKERHLRLIDIKPGAAESVNIEVDYDSSSEFVQVDIYVVWGTK